MASSHKLLKEYYPESQFGGLTDVDGTATFYLRIGSLVSQESIVLDVGCGRGAHFDRPEDIRLWVRNLKGRCRKVIGIDLDPAARQNPGVDEFRLITSSTWPIEDSSIDVCICDYVVEHVPDPNQFFAELRRVCKPGGFICIRTANVLSYFGLAAKCIANRWHNRVLRIAQPHRKAEDIFPTCYRCNTVFTMRKFFKKFGFEGYVYGHESEPTYLSFSKLAYALGVLHQRFAPKFMRVGIMGFGRKRE